MLNNQLFLVIKVGGSFFEQEQAQQDFFAALNILRSYSYKIVLVHGGGQQIQARLSQLGFNSEKYQGLRITPSEHMPIVAGVLAGELNKRLVAKAKTAGIAACGISLADGNMTTCTALEPKLGAVGKVAPEDPEILKVLLASHCLPIVASIAADSHGQLYNVNADDAAVCIAQLLQARLMLLSDVNAVLDAKGESIKHLSQQQQATLIEDGVIRDGMTVKVAAAQAAADSIQQSVVIGNWSQLAAFAKHPKQAFGTEFTPSKDYSYEGTNDSASTAL